MSPPRNAPPVVYPVGRSRFLGASLALLWLAGAVLVAAAGVGGHLPGWRIAVAGGGVLFAGVWAGMFWHRLPHAVLRWDGAAWWFEGRADGRPAEPGVLRLHLDLQRHLLLAWSAPPDGVGGGRRPRWGAPRAWLWADAQADRSRWHGLRCAVYSLRAKPEVPDGAADP